MIAAMQWNYLNISFDYQSEPPTNAMSAADVVFFQEIYRIFLKSYSSVFYYCTQPC